MAWQEYWPYRSLPTTINRAGWYLVSVPGVARTKELTGREIELFDCRVAHASSYIIYYKYEITSGNTGDSSRVSFAFEQFAERTNLPSIFTTVYYPSYHTRLFVPCWNRVSRNSKRDIIKLLLKPTRAWMIFQSQIRYKKLACFDGTIHSSILSTGEKLGNRRSVQSGEINNMNQIDEQLSRFALWFEIKFQSCLRKLIN